MMSENCQVPEGYKKTELGIIPEDWDIKELTKTFSIIDYRGRTPPYSENGVPYIGADNIKDARIVFNKRRYVSEETYVKYMTRGIPNPGDILFTTEAPLGNVAQVPDYKFCFAQRVVVFQCKNNFSPLFFMYLLKNKMIQKQFLNWATGTTVTGISSKNMRFIKLYYPKNIAEQQKIASILSKVDEQIEQTEQIIEKTELLKKGLMQNLLIKGIGHKKFKKTELGKIPEEWKLMILDETADVIDPHPSHRAPKIVPEGYPFAGIGDILEDGTILSEKCRKVSEEAVIEQEKSYTIDEDIGFGRVGTVGKVVWLKKQAFRYSISPTLSIIKPKAVNRYYLFYAIKSGAVLQQINNFITGSTRESIGIMKLRKVKILLPPLSEQQKIASILSKVDSQIQDNQNYLTKLQELKRGLMQDLLTGKVRVRN